MKSVFCLIVGVLITVQSQAYPEILSWKEAPLIVFENKSSAVLQKNVVIKSPFFAVTANQDELSLKMTPQTDLIIYPKSKVQVPEVFSQDVATYEIFLFDGQMRIKHQGLLDPSQKLNRIRTVFFDLTQPEKTDALIAIDMKEPSVEISLIKGQWPLEFFAYEKKITLKAGEKVKFKGVLATDGGEGIQYDYLLKERKAPQGKLGEVQKADLSHFYAAEKEAEARVNQKKKALQKKVEDQIKKRKAYEDSFLCKKPFAQKDQCAWWIEKQKCFRKRCNVSGGWGDVTERPLQLETKCTKDFTVGDCDY